MSELCAFTENNVGCMMRAERDNLCVPHWRFKLGHEPTTEGLGDDAGKEVAPYCKRCRGILGSQTEDDPCRAKMMNILVVDSRKALMDIIKRLAGGRDIDEILGNRAFGEARDEADCDERGLTGEEAKKVLIDLLGMIPPCPDCQSNVCVEWLQRYFRWIMTAMLGPSGFMAMFIACLEREGGEIEFTREEIIEAGKVLKVENEVKFDNSSTRARIVERSSDFPDIEEAADHYWPDEIG